MLDEKDYKELSEYVYWLDSKHKLYDPDIKEEFVFVGENADYKILKVEDNTTNGMQAGGCCTSPRW